MKHRRMLASLAGAGLVAALALWPSSSGQPSRAFDPALAQGVACTTASSGPPFLLTRLVSLRIQPQVQPQVETRPFQPGTRHRRHCAPRRQRPSSRCAQGPGR